MRALDGPKLAAYAREQLRAASLILARHHNEGPLCSCGRVEHCSVKLHVLRRIRHFQRLLAALDAPTAVLPPTKRTLIGEVIDRDAPGQHDQRAARTGRRPPARPPRKRPRWT